MMTGINDKFFFGANVSHSEHDDFLLQRQQQVISAAKVCFSRSGFHGASMADISRESALGAGQIYRYFSSKELIVMETIKSIAQNWRLFLIQHLPAQQSTQDIINADSPFWQHWPSQDRKLLLEMYSEASRNESVRTILAQQEQLLLAELAAIFRAQQPDIDPTQRANRIQFLLLLVDGVACRAFSDSDLNQHEMQRVNGVLSQHLFG
ncbi:TetR/AcrR family transcriptional regulator [Pantoea sp. GCM10028869]|jgi:AcrR family transcriptional regulator|uniref:TetR/AcrR family transcriptional regulator n=1 Tax=Pantoea sp. GCM10028869 TaxID=3273417 RepID=UPI0036142814